MNHTNVTMTNRGNITIIGGQSGSGKTTKALEVMRDSDCKVVFISCEHTARGVISHMMQRHGVTGNELRLKQNVWFFGEYNNVSEITTEQLSGFDMVVLDANATYLDTDWWELSNQLRSLGKEVVITVMGWSINGTS